VKRYTDLCGWVLPVPNLAEPTGRDRAV